MRNKLLGSSLINAFVDRGLQLPRATTSIGVKNRREVVAIGVCLVLLVAGHVLVSEWNVYDVEMLEKVVKALHLMKEKQVIKYPTGVDLLEVGVFFMPRLEKIDHYSPCRERLLQLKVGSQLRHLLQKPGTCYSLMMHKMKKTPETCNQIAVLHF